VLPQEIKVSFATTSRPCNISEKINPYHPWDWYINPHEWLIFMVFMKVNIPYMDSMGKINLVAKVVGGGGGGGHGGYGGGGGGGAVVVVILGKNVGNGKKTTTTAHASSRASRFLLLRSPKWSLQSHIRARWNLANSSRPR